MSFFIEHIEVRELLERSSDAINHQDWGALANMMTEDVVWERKPPTPWILQGREAVSSFLTGNLNKLTILHYDVSASAVEIIDPTHAMCRSTMTELIRLHDSDAVLRVVGTYNDDLINSAGLWKFARRAITPRFEQDFTGQLRILTSSVISPSE
jgi:ketosteroid isomerase-like protein